MTPENTRGFAALTVVLLIWSCIAVVLRYFTGILDAWTMIGARYTFVFLVAAPMLLRESLRKDAHIPWKAAIIPAVIYGLGQILWSIAPYHNTASVVMFISRCAFLFSVVGGFWLLDSERWLLKQPLFRIGFAVITVGLGLLFLAAAQAPDSSEISVKGVVIMTATAACWGFYGVSVRRWFPGVPARVGFPLLSVLTWPVFFTGFLTFGDPASLLILTGPQWALLVAAGLVSIGLGQFLSYICMQTIGPIVTEGSYNIIPFTATALAWWWLGETLSPMQWSAGCAIVAGSVCLLVVRARKDELSVR